MEKIKLSSLLNVTDKNQNIALCHFIDNIDTITIENGKIAKYEFKSKQRIYEIKTAECWNALIKLNEIEDGYIKRIIPCEYDNKDILYIELE